MSEESVVSSRLRDLTEFTEDEGRDDTQCDIMTMR